MKIKIILLLVSVTSFVYSCKNKNLEASLLLSPEAGTTYKQGQEVIVKLSYPADLKPDSIVYLIDSVRIASKKDSSAVSLKTDTMLLGPRGVTAKFYHDGK